MEKNMADIGSAWMEMHFCLENWMRTINLMENQYSIFIRISAPFWEAAISMVHFKKVEKNVSTSIFSVCYVSIFSGRQVQISGLKKEDGIILPECIETDDDTLYTNDQPSRFCISKNPFLRYWSNLMCKKFLEINENYYCKKRRMCTF